MYRGLAAAFVGSALCAAAALPGQDSGELFEQTFDAHWERLRDGYPYFELYGVDWEAERAEHRPRALAASDPTEFAWELARLISALPDPHVAFVPSPDALSGWSFPDLETHLIERRPHVTAWADDVTIEPPPAFADDPHAYPELVSIRGEPALGSAQILVAGPAGTTLDCRLRWPDGTETVHVLTRSKDLAGATERTHFGERWLITGRVGSIGYVAVKSFNPQQCTLGPAGKITTMLRAALRELADTDGLILDLQGNGGGVVAASDPFLGNLIEARRSYRWGNGAASDRVITPRKPRYTGAVVALVDERTASGGEWVARILRDAGRAQVVGGRTKGAEAAVQRSEGPDGSVVHYSAWPMVEPGVKPFQEVGVELDHALPLTLADVRAHGYDEALARVRRARLAKALEVLGAADADLDALVTLAAGAEPATSTESPDR